MLLIVISKCDRDKDEDRYYIHKNDADCRQRHESDVESSIDQTTNKINQKRAAKP